MKTGVSVRCRVCDKTKQPRGRSAPMDMDLCTWDCEGYNQDPQPGSLWPGETDRDFGYPVGPHGWTEPADEGRDTKS